MVPLNRALFQQDLLNLLFMLHGKISRCNFVSLAQY